MPKANKRQKKTQSRRRSTGWLTTDADEIERRRLRGANESFQIQSQANDNSIFGVYRVDSGKGHNYRVEIRSLSEAINSCDCPDHRINELGTCKHIEATLHLLQHRHKAAFKTAATKGSPFIEVYLDRRSTGPDRLAWGQATAL
jgi:hypothetical protein